VRRFFLGNYRSGLSLSTHRPVTTKNTGKYDSIGDKKEKNHVYASILQYLIGFIFLSNNVGIHFVLTYYFRLVPMFSGITTQILNPCCCSCIEREPVCKNNSNNKMLKVYNFRIKSGIGK
jgi:hypothetical protein